MPKIIKKIKTTSKPTASKKVVDLPKATSSEIKECKPIDKLTTAFQNEDMNKLVEKINELIDKSNGTI